VKIFRFLAQNFYSVGIMILFTLAALVISLAYYKRHRNLRIFTYYIAFSLLADMYAFYAFPYSSNAHFQLVILWATNQAFMLFEFIACNLFILRYTASALRRRIIRINGLLFFGFLILISIRIYPRNLSVSFVLWESIFLVPPCLIYFYDLFLRVTLRPLRDQPAFWIVTGILFLHACDIPLWLTVPFLGKYAEAAYTLNYIFYIMLFILLIRAYLCAPEESPVA